MRATRVVPDRAAAPVPLDLRDFPSAFGELKTLLLEVETQFRWDSQQTTWEACAEHWRRRVREFDPGDADLAWRLSRALLGASTTRGQKPRPVPCFLPPLAKSFKKNLFFFRSIKTFFADQLSPRASHPSQISKPP